MFGLSWEIVWDMLGELVLSDPDTQIEKTWFWTERYSTNSWNWLLRTMSILRTSTKWASVRDIWASDPGFIRKIQSTSLLLRIGSITEDGHFDCILRKGTNWENEILQFLIDLDEKFQARYGADFREFRKRNVIILDNAAYHKTELISRFAKKQGIQMLTLPQYTPEWNPIEIVWSWVKRNLSKMNMNSR